MNKHPLNRDRTHKLQVLKNRRDFLESKLTRDLPPSERYQRAELGALNWAIQTISMVYDVEFEPRDIEEDGVQDGVQDEDAKIAAFRARIVQPSDVTQERSQA